MTQYPDLFADLAAPFEEKEVRSRSQGGKQVPYITARVAMNRLDTVLGPENWWDDYTPGPNSVLCRLTIRLPDGSTLTKADAGGYAGMADQGDDDKSGYSDAFKRAGVKFGVGRYLYRDGVPSFVRDREAAVSDQSGPEVIGKPAGVAPASGKPADNGHVKERGRWGNSQPGQPATPNGNGKAPSSGRGLFAWTKEMEQRHEVGLLKYLNSWAKLQDFPGRMVDWDADQVRQGYEEAARKLQSIAAGHAEAHEEALSS